MTQPAQGLGGEQSALSADDGLTHPLDDVEHHDGRKRGIFGPLDYSFTSPPMAALRRMDEPWP